MKDPTSLEAKYQYTEITIGEKDVLKIVHRDGNGEEKHLNLLFEGESVFIKHRLYEGG